LATGAAVVEPEAAARFEIVIEHLRDTLAFYGDRLGLRIFRKHLGWYVEQAPWPSCAQTRREAKSALCRLESGEEVERGLSQLWGLERRLAA
jgi:tRNA-dihydrouridine synthase